jgi:hypothetical protein
MNSTTDAAINPISSDYNGEQASRRAPFPKKELSIDKSSFPFPRTAHSKQVVRIEYILINEKG